LTGLVERTWGAERAAEPDLEELQRVSMRAVVDGLINLASDGEATIGVRAVTELKLKELSEMIAVMEPLTPGHKAHLEQAVRDIQRYFEQPADRLRPAAIPRLGPF